MAAPSFLQSLTLPARRWSSFLFADADFFANAGQDAAFRGINGSHGKTERRGDNVRLVPVDGGSPKRLPSGGIDVGLDTSRGPEKTLPMGFAFPKVRFLAAGRGQV